MLHSKITSDESHIVFRPYLNSRSKSLVQVRSTGHYTRSVELTGRLPMQKFFIELFWCKKGKLEFKTGKDMWHLNAGEVCFYLPGDIHDIRELTDEWEMYWMSLDGPYMDWLIQAFELSHEPRQAGACPTELFSQLNSLISGATLTDEYLAGVCAFEILTRAVMGETLKYSQDVQEFMRLVENNYSNPACDINELCRKLNIHRSTLFRKTLSELGETPLNYLNSRRIQKAIELLQQRTYKLEQIAEMTGFNSAKYFTKVFRRTLRILPRELASQFHSPEGTVFKSAAARVSKDITGKSAVRSVSEIINKPLNTGADK